MSEQISIGNHIFEQGEVGFEEAEDAPFFIKAKAKNLKEIQWKENQRKYIKQVYEKIPTIVPPMKIITFQEDGATMYGEYTAKIDFRGFFTPATLYRSQEFCNFAAQQETFKKELLQFIDTTKKVLNGVEGINTLPEFTTWGNMGVDFNNHIRIIDYHPIPIFKKTKNSTKQPQLSDSGYDYLAFCFIYEYFYSLQEHNGEPDAQKQAGSKILTDPLYRKYFFDKFNIHVAPEELGSFLQKLDSDVSGNYFNLTTVMERRKKGYNSK